MRKTVLHAVLFSSLLGIACTTTPTQPSPDCQLDFSPAGNREFRNKRYCEILMAQGAGRRLTGCVYNTACNNDCSEELWSALDADELKKQFNATAIVLNGPRYFVMDFSSSTTASQQQVNFDGVVMCPLAAIDLPPGSLLPGNAQVPYTETTIDRRTEYVYDKDRPIYLLLSPDKAAYIMQSYSQIVDPNLTYEQLPLLGQHLKMPDGWRYVPATPKTTLHVRSHGSVQVLQDELQNTYQRLGDQELAAIRELLTQ